MHSLDGLRNGKCLLIRVNAVIHFGCSNDHAEYQMNNYKNKNTQYHEAYHQST